MTPALHQVLQPFQIFPQQPHCLLYLIPQFYPKHQATQIFKQLHIELSWQSSQIKLFGRLVTIPRLQAWYGDPMAYYTYSGIQLSPIPWHPQLYKIKTNIQQQTTLNFNSVLANLYAHGTHYMGWHSDNEKALGKFPIIASLSLGAQRRFYLKHKVTQDKLKLMLSHGDLLIMAGETQDHWQHTIPKQTTVTTARINLTYRNIFSI